MPGFTKVTTEDTGWPVPWFPAPVLVYRGMLPVPVFTEVDTEDAGWPVPWFPTTLLVYRSILPVPGFTKSILKAPAGQTVHVHSYQDPSWFALWKLIR